MKMNCINILYVDDEINNLNAFKAIFRRHYKIFTALSADEGLEVLRNNLIHIVITDQKMPIKTGINFLEDVVKEFPDAIRILITGYSDITVVIDAINKGHVYRYLMKPFNDIELRVTILNAMELYNLRTINIELERKLNIVTEKLNSLLEQN